ncbi:nucleoside phosphorylase domain-containing protein [Aspergillus pseudoustus]|uniref:Nucleoside phosphorylase domain-containing protein n=1 Tax=Aspergillus pseudoustus TaxID=1810923 RepID=A0ABR4JYB8_9EURO
MGSSSSKQPRAQASASHTAAQPQVHISNTNTRTRSIRPESVKIFIFCALKIEETAVISSLDERLSCNPMLKGDQKYNLTVGRIGNNTVVISRPRGTGPVNAAQCAAYMSYVFPNIRIAFTVGIGGGIPNPPARDIRLGDIAVGVPRGNQPAVFLYDTGKYEQGGFVPNGTANNPPSICINIDQALEEDELMNRSPLGATLKAITATCQFTRPTTADILFMPGFRHVTPGANCSNCRSQGKSKIIKRDPRPDHTPVVHRGLILSGGGVVKTPRDRDTLRRAQKNAICYEMEAIGVAEIFPCFVVRGISDYSDTHKQDGWHGYAAAAAAAYCKTVLCKIPPM